MFRSAKRALAATMLCAILSACGGSGGGGGIVSAPPPPPPPPPPLPPPNDPSVDLIAAPASQDLAVATRYDPIQIRYDASRNLYEVKAATFDWSAVIDDPAVPSDTNQSFTIAGQPAASYLRIVAHHRATDPARRYRYSNLAYWSTDAVNAGDFGKVAALGAATPLSGIPLSGTASFQGLAVGEADIKDTGWGFATTRLEGPVKLDFDFAAGSLSGTIALATACDCSNDVSTGTIAFDTTVFARGSQTFSGSFATSAAGLNAFDGLFTGPKAEELIGAWTLPFMFQGVPHQAWGSWIAKRE